MNVIVFSVFITQYCTTDLLFHLTLGLVRRYSTFLTWIYTTGFDLYQSSIYGWISRTAGNCAEEAQAQVRFNARLRPCDYSKKQIMRQLLLSLWLLTMRVLQLKSTFVEESLDFHIYPSMLSMLLLYFWLCVLPGFLASWLGHTCTVQAQLSNVVLL